MNIPEVLFVFLILFAVYFAFRGLHLFSVGIICLPSVRYRKGGFLLIVLSLVPILLVSAIGYLVWSDHKLKAEEERLAQERVDLFRLEISR